MIIETLVHPPTSVTIAGRTGDHATTCTLKILLMLRMSARTVHRAAGVLEKSKWLRDVSPLVSSKLYTVEVTYIYLSRLRR